MKNLTHRSRALFKSESCNKIPEAGPVAQFALPRRRARVARQSGGLLIIVREILRSWVQIPSGPLSSSVLK